MKKFIIAFVVVFVANLGCKKIIDQPLCACSPITYPGFSLAVKNANGDDLLNPTTANSFTKEQIQLFQKDANGTIKQISFYIRPPFDNTDIKFKYHQIISDEIVSLSAGTNANKTFYLKLGTGATYELNLELNSGSRKVEKVLIDKKEAPLATDTGIDKIINIFYLNV